MPDTNPILAHLVEHYERYKGYVESLLRNRDDAEDIVQLLAHKFATFTESEAADIIAKYHPFEKFIFVSAKYASISLIRRRQRHAQGNKRLNIELPSLDTPSPRDAPDEKSEQWQTKVAAFRDCLQRLVQHKPKQGATIVALYSYHQKHDRAPTMEEIAESVRATVVNVKCNLCLGRKNLSECINKKGYTNIFGE